MYKVSAFIKCVITQTISVSPHNILILNRRRSMAPHSSTLAWRIPGTGESGGLLSMGSYRFGHD